MDGEKYPPAKERFDGDLPVSHEVRARSLLSLLWAKFDAAGISMGRSWESVVLEAAMELLGPPDAKDLSMLRNDGLGHTRDYLSRRRLEESGLRRAALAKPEGEG